MQKLQQRTDLAMEARALAIGKDADEIEGVIYQELAEKNMKYQKLEVVTKEGAEAIGKPIGIYYTAEISSVLRRESESFGDTVSALAKLFLEILGEVSENGTVLVVGLGNRDITPDIIGPMTVDSILVTRHLKQHAPEDFKFLNPVAAICPGVLGTSGIESADYIKWVCSNLRPDKVVVIDALASNSLDRLCRTVQITNTGITPGSGVGNSRNAINAETLGVPVVAVGVPTVVDIRSLLLEMGDKKLSQKAALGNDMIVTPRNIDSEVVCASRVVAYALNLAFHKGLTIEDVDMMVG